MNALIKPAIILVKQVFQKLVSKIISDSSILRKTKSTKTEIAKGKMFPLYIGDDKKPIIRTPATATEKYITVFHETSISVFLKMLKITDKISVSSIMHIRNMNKVSESQMG